MITLEQIVTSNLEMLKEQEASLLNSLEFIRKAKQLFESQGSTSTRGGTRQKRRGRKKRIVAAKAVRKAKTATRAGRKRSGGSHLDRIMGILKETSKPISSGELLDTLYSRQSADKDRKHFGTLIYPVLTKAYKSGVLVSKKGKIHLGS